MKINKFFLRLFLIVTITLTVVVNSIVVWAIIKYQNNNMSFTATIKTGETKDEIYGTIIEESNVELQPFFVKILIAFNIIMLLVIIYDLKRITTLKKFENKLNEIKESYQNTAKDS